MAVLVVAAGGGKGDASGNALGIFLVVPVSVVCVSCWLQSGCRSRGRAPGWLVRRNSWRIWANGWLSDGVVGLVLLPGVAMVLMDLSKILCECC